jgi:hypothetical protein
MPGFDDLPHVTKQIPLGFSFSKISACVNNALRRLRAEKSPRLTKEKVKEWLTDIRDQLTQLEKIKKELKRWVATQIELIEHQNQSIGQLNLEIQRFNHQLKNGILKTEEINQAIRNYQVETKNYNRAIKELNKEASNLGLSPLPEPKLLSEVFNSQVESLPLLDSLSQPPDLHKTMNRFYLPLLKQILTLLHSNQTVTDQMLASFELANYYRLIRSLSKNVIEEFSTLHALHGLEESLSTETHEDYLSQILGIREETLNRLLSQEVRHLIAEHHQASISPEFYERCHLLTLTLLSQNSLLAFEFEAPKASNNTTFAIEFAKNISLLINNGDLQELISEFLINEIGRSPFNLQLVATQMNASFNLSLLLFSLSMLSKAFSLPGLPTQLIMNIAKNKQLRCHFVKELNNHFATRLALPMTSRKQREKTRLHIAEAFIKRGVSIEDALKMASDVLKGSYKVQSPEVKYRPLLNTDLDQVLPLSEFRQELRNEILLWLTPSLDPKEALALAEEMILLLGITEARDKSLTHSFWHLLSVQLEVLEKEKNLAIMQALAKQLQGFMKPDVELFVILLRWMNREGVLPPLSDQNDNHMIA